MNNDDRHPSLCADIPEEGKRVAGARLFETAGTQEPVSTLYCAALPRSKYARNDPLPFSSIVPRSSNTNLWRNAEYVTSLTWIAPGIPYDSRRLAVFTVSPHKS